MSRNADDVAQADLVLAGVALPLTLGALASVPLSLGLGTALGVASLPAAGAVGYGLFYDPPEA